MNKVKASCVFVFDYNTNKVLSVTRKNDHNDWGLPGGKMEDNETPVETAIRELYEETGYFVKDNVKLDSSNVWFLDEKLNGDKDPVCVLVLTVNDIEKESVKSDPNETGLVDWVTLDKIYSGSFGDFNKRFSAMYFLENLNKLITIVNNEPNDYVLGSMIRSLVLGNFSKKFDNKPYISNNIYTPSNKDLHKLEEEYLTSITD